MFGRYSLRYMGYRERDSIHLLQWPGDLGPRGTPEGKGKFFVFSDKEAGRWNLVQGLYPGGKGELIRDPWNHAGYYLYEIPPALVDAARGLRAGGRGVSETIRFVGEKPANRSRLDLRGSYYCAAPDNYRFRFSSPGVRVFLAGKPLLPGRKVKLLRGFYPIRVVWENPPSILGSPIEMEDPAGLWKPLDPDNLTALEISRGLQGSYFRSDEAGTAPFLEEWDPLVDFEGLDFPTIPGPFWADWRGKMDAPVAGAYEWKMFTSPSEKARLIIDRKAVTPWEAQPAGSVVLSRGTHLLEVKYQSDGGLFSFAVLLWKPPGREKFDFVPNEVFGKIESHMNLDLAVEVP
jgi:hypothetical protein